MGNSVSGEYCLKDDILKNPAVETTQSPTFANAITRYFKHTGLQEKHSQPIRLCKNVLHSRSRTKKILFSHQSEFKL